MSEPVVYVLAGGDLVVATTSQWVAEHQQLAMIGANLDVEQLTMTMRQWERARAGLAALDAPPTITELTEQ